MSCLVFPSECLSKHKIFGANQKLWDDYFGIMGTVGTGGNVKPRDVICLTLPATRHEKLDSV